MNDIGAAAGPSWRAPHSTRRCTGPGPGRETSAARSRRSVRSKASTMSPLGREIFCTLGEAKVLIDRWRHEYNTFRPRSALGCRPPAPRQCCGRSR